MYQYWLDCARNIGQIMHEIFRGQKYARNIGQIMYEIFRGQKYARNIGQIMYQIFVKSSNRITNGQTHV